MPEIYFHAETEGLIWMVSKGKLPADVFADEHELFDRPKTRYFLTTECVTALGAG